MSGGDRLLWGRGKLPDVAVGAQYPAALNRAIFRHMTEVEGDDAKKSSPANKMGTYLGVIQPCLLNIFGAIIFLRLSWAVGEAGWLGVVLMFCLSGTLVVLTALSVAAISTNGNMGGGGAHAGRRRRGRAWLVATVGGVRFYCQGKKNTTQ